MAKKTALGKLSEALTKVLNEYAADVQNNLDAITKDMGQKGAQALRQKSKETFDGTGKYASGWTYTVENLRTGARVTIHNKLPGLPHLLEFGHVTRNGTGRTYPRTPAHEHIAPVADEIVRTFEQEVKSKL